eukprot:1161595-Pelagomonas_calceolata.AAC.1
MKEGVCSVSQTVSGAYNGICSGHNALVKAYLVACMLQKHRWLLIPYKQGTISGRLSCKLLCNLEVSEQVFLGKVQVGTFCFEWCLLVALGNRSRRTKNTKRTKRIRQSGGGAAAAAVAVAATETSFNKAIG